MSQKEKDSVDLIAHWQLLKENRRIIFVICLFSLIFTLIFTVFSPKIYISEATIIVSEETDTAAGGLSGLPGLLIPRFGGMSPSTSLIMGLLKSRRMAVDCIDALHLEKIYGTDISHYVGA